MMEIWVFLWGLHPIVQIILLIAAAFFCLHFPEMVKNIISWKWWKERRFFAEVVPILIIITASVLPFIHLCPWLLEKLPLANKLSYEDVKVDWVGHHILVIAGSITWFFLYRRARAAEQNAKAAQKSVDVAQLTSAIKQIGDKDIYVRIGGILGLRQIGLSDNTNRDERRKIAHILASFIREHAKKNSETPNGEQLELIDYSKAEDTPRRGFRVEENFPSRDKRVDIEAAVNALADIASTLKYREKAREFKERKHHLCDLRNTDLHGLRFVKADLSYFDFENACLVGAWFRKANFKNARLDRANFTKALVYAAKFTNADISETTFTTTEYLTQKQISQAYRVKGYTVHLPEGWQLPPEKDCPIGDAKPGENPDESWREIISLRWASFLRRLRRRLSNTRMKG